MEKVRSFEVFAWDNGNANEKFAYRNERGEIKNIVFPSLTTEIIEDNFLFQLEDIDLFTKNNMKLKFNGLTYCVGKLAQEQDSQGGNRDQLEDKFRTTSSIVKLLAGIALAVNNIDVDIINIENLMLGLSINTYHKYKEQVEEFYSNRKFTFEIPVRNGYKQYLVTIQRAYCIAQGVGAFYDEVLEYTGFPKRADLLKKRYLLIDGGGGTTEYFIADGKKPILGTENYIHRGANDVFQSIGNLYNGAPGQIIETVFREQDPNQYWNSKNPLPLEVITKQVETAFSALGRSFFQTINNNLKEHLNRVGVVLITGGIADYIYNELSELFGDRYEVLKSDRPLFSNVNGYFKYYELIKLKRDYRRLSANR